VVRGEQHAHTAAADQDPGYLGPFVAHAQQEEGDYYNADYGPEVEELGGEDVLDFVSLENMERAGRDGRGEIRCNGRLGR
jgi:hypothetical protein